MSQHDQLPSVSYADLIIRVLRVYRKARSHEDFMHELGLSFLDVTDRPEYLAMAGALPLPSGFAERTYQFRDPSIGFGVMDAAFLADDLVNIRVQVFFTGWFARGRAGRYLFDTIAPILQGEFGDPADHDRDHILYRGRGLISVARCGTPGPFVSVGITDEAFV